MRTCTRCDGPVSETARYCEHCGHGLAGAAQGASMAVKLIGGLFLALCALGAGLTGACFVLIGVSDSHSGGAMVVGLPLLAIGAGCLYLLAKLLR